MWVDSHCHINGPEFSDLADVLKRMKENEVLKALIVSCDLEQYEIAKTINDPLISFKRSLGLYPGDVEEYQNIYPLFEKNFLNDDIVAIGEIGLDYHYGNENRLLQQEYFIKQLDIAKSLNKPVIVHSRDASQETFDILKKYQVDGVIHCYSGSKELAMEYLKLGYYISLSGVLTFKNARNAIEVLKAIGLNHLLIETDSPYMAPTPFRGKRNEPAFVSIVGEKVSEILNEDKTKVQMIIEQNYEALFGKGERK